MSCSRQRRGKSGLPAASNALQGTGSSHCLLTRPVQQHAAVPRGGFGMLSRIRPARAACHSAGSRGRQLGLQSSARLRSWLGPRRASRPTALGWHRTACWCACWGILVQSFFSGPEAALLARCPGLFLFARPLYTHSVNACADSSFPSVPLICWFCDHLHFSLLDSRSRTARSKQGTSVGWGGDS